MADSSGPKVPCLCIYRAVTGHSVAGIGFNLLCVSCVRVHKKRLQYVGNKFLDK